MPLESQPQTSGTSGDNASDASTNGKDDNEAMNLQVFVNSTKWKRFFFDLMVKQCNRSNWCLTYVLFLTIGVLLSFLCVFIASLTVGGAPYIKERKSKMKWKDGVKLVFIIIYTIVTCILGGFILRTEYNWREIFLDTFFEKHGKCTISKLTKREWDLTLAKATFSTTSSLWVHILLFGFTIFDVQLYGTWWDRVLAAFSCYVMIIPHAYLIEMSFICWILITLETQFHTQVKQLVDLESVSKAEIEKIARSHHKFSILVLITNKEKKHIFGCIFVLHCFYFGLSVLCWLLASDWDIYWSCFSFLEAFFNLAIFLINSLFISKVGSNSLKILFNLESLEYTSHLELSSKIVTFKDRLRQDLTGIEVGELFRGTKKNLLKIILFDLVFTVVKIIIYALRFMEIPILRNIQRSVEARNDSEVKSE